MIAGQSNAVGFGTNLQVYSGPNSYIYNNAYGLSPLTDPVDNGSGQLDTVSLDDATNAKGTYWIQMANALQRNITLVPCAKGGSTITQWQPGADHEDRSTLYGSMIYRAKQAIAAGGNLKCVLWHQGEAEASGGMSEADYNAKLDTIANAVYADIGVKLMPCKIQNCTDRDETAVNAAITTAWGDNANVLQGPDLSDITPSANPAHLTTDAELLEAGTRWANAIKTAFGW